MPTQSISGDDRLVSRGQGAEALGLRTQTLAKWSMDGRHLRVVRIGRTVRYRWSDVQRLMAEGSNSPQQAV